MKIITKEILSADGKKITIQTGKLAKQAHGSVEVRQGNTVILATVVSDYEAREGVDFLPLSVDYQEKFASTGNIPGGFLKREGRISDHEILVSRLVDRALRPLFPSTYHANTQMLITLVSSDDNVMPDSLAALAASSALMVSDIPFAGPISEVRVARRNGEFIVNPTKAELDESDIDLMLAASEENISMVEGEMSEVSEAEMLEAMKIAHDAIKIQCRVQKELEAEAGTTVKREFSHENDDAELEKVVYDLFYDKCYAVTAEQNPNKNIRSDKFGALLSDHFASLSEDDTTDRDLVSKYFKKAQKAAVRNFMLAERSRLDGRKLDEIRPIWCEANYLPSPHGSAVFTRGETQSMTTCTLGTKMDQQMINGAVYSGTSKFILHYNFPAFSTGEARPNRGPGRREVGHGNLAFRALKKVLPSDEENKYTIRVVSDILESNGSSSMATVCAGSLALMDAGVPIKAPVSGIAMGLISDPESGKYAVLSDILGDEDHLGDMDFKVTGTAKGITACQMDIKVEGLSYEVLTEALNQARAGRLHILDEMTKELAAPRTELKDNAPRFFDIVIPKDLIGAVIGPGGKIIQEIQASTGATVTIEEVDNKGVVTIFSASKESLDAAVMKVKGIVAMPEEGEVYEGKVKSIMPYGAFVEFMPGKDGLLHVSEISWDRVENPADALTEGEVIKVKLVSVDPKTGKFKLSRKVLLPKPERTEK